MKPSCVTCENNFKFTPNCEHCTHHLMYEPIRDVERIDSIVYELQCLRERLVKSHPEPSDYTDAGECKPENEINKP